jgi:hypothetical protein
MRHDNSQPWRPESSHASQDVQELPPTAAQSSSFLGFDALRNQCDEISFQRDNASSSPTELLQDRIWDFIRGDQAAMKPSEPAPKRDKAQLLANLYEQQGKLKKVKCSEETKVLRSPCLVYDKQQGKLKKVKCSEETKVLRSPCLVYDKQQGKLIAMKPSEPTLKRDKTQLLANPYEQQGKLKKVKCSEETKALRSYLEYDKKQNKLIAMKPSEPAPKATEAGQANKNLEEDLEFQERLNQLNRDIDEKEQACIQQEVLTPMQQELARIQPEEQVLNQKEEQEKKQQKEDDDIYSSLGNIISDFTNFDKQE